MALLAQLIIEVEAGRVTAFVHPSLPLVGFNYTELCQFGKVWNKTNLQCRGLILASSGELVARPFKKFFNYEELSADQKVINPQEIDYIATKEDGSLIIGFYYSGRWWFSTRGSFVSYQAQAARVLWKVNPRYDEFANTECTYLFELVGPSNRNVTRGYKEDELILLGIIHTQSGNEYGRNGIHRYAKLFSCNYAKEWTWNDELLQYVKSNTDPNFEGIVVTKKNGLRFKLKSNVYCQLHRVITGDWTTKRVLDIWKSQQEGTFMLDPAIPDEFYTELKEHLAAVNQRWEDWRCSKQTILDLMRSYVRQKYQEEEPDCKMMRKDLALMFPNGRPYLNLFFCGTEFLLAEWDKISYELFTKQELQ